MPGSYKKLKKDQHLNIRISAKEVALLKEKAERATCPMSSTAVAR